MRASPFLLLCATCIAVLLNVRKGEAVPVEASFDRWETTLTAQKQAGREAVLTDPVQLYRVVSSRPGRVFPSHGSRLPNPGSKLQGAYIRSAYTAWVASALTNCRLQSAPFCTSAPRHYYVIALRHILC